MFTPCNEMNTTAMVKEAKKMASELGIMRNIIRGEEFRVGGFGGGFYGRYLSIRIGGVSRLSQAP